MINENATDTHQELLNERKKKNIQKIITIVNTVACSLLLVFASGAAMMSPMIAAAKTDNSFDEMFAYLVFIIVATYPVVIIISMVIFWNAYKKGNEKMWKKSSLAPWVLPLCAALLIGLFALLGVAFND